MNDIIKNKSFIVIKIRVPKSSKWIVLCSNIIHRQNCDSIQSIKLELLFPNYTQVLNVKYTTTQMQSEHYFLYAILSKIALHTKTIIKLHMTP